MTAWALLAPGPSASAAQAKAARDAGRKVGAVGNAYELAPWADFIAASDSAWWTQNMAALQLPGRKFAMHVVGGTELVKIPALNTVCNSGVMALEVARRLGATIIELYGFDMRGTHFFGEYTNGLRNTTDQQRERHLSQYRKWAAAAKDVRVINRTIGSALDCFPFA